MLLVLGLAASGCFNNRAGSARAARNSAPPDAPAPTAPAPTGDANSGAPPSMFGAPRCSPSLPFCESFEASDAPDPQRWSVLLSGSGSTAVRDSSRAARGSQSIHLHTGAGGYAQAVLSTRTPFPVAANSFYGRAFVYLDNAGKLPQAHWTLIEAAGRLAGASSDTLVRYGGQFTHLMANYYGADQYEHAADNVDGEWVNQTLMPVNRWACFEWQFKGDSNEMHLWLDGSEITKIAIFGSSTQCCANQPWTMPSFSSLRLGWQVYQADSSQPGYDLWLDEVALGSSRIGCTD